MTKNYRPKPSRVFLKLLIISIIPFSLFGKENSKMEQAVDKFFAAANVSGGSTSFKDDGRLSLIGGSAYLRNEVSNIQPFHVSLPSISVGCGGIDFRMGALSTVSHKEMKKVLENIAKGGASELFVLALDSVSPQIAGMTAKIQHWQNQLNSININSCEIGTSLAQGMWPKGTAAKERICQQAAAKQSFFKNRIEAKHGCRDQTNEGTKKAKALAEGEGILGDNFNLAWRVIKGNGLTENQEFVADTDLHDLYLNISGTILSNVKEPSKVEKKPKKKEETTPPQGEAAIQFFQPKAKEAMDVLMNGGILTGAYRFDPKNELTILTEQTITITEGKKSKLQKALKSLAAKIIEERKGTQTLTAEELALIQNTTFPIAKLVSVMARHNGNLAKNFLSLDQIAGQIAFDQVSSYVENVLTKLISYSKELEAKQLTNCQILPYQETLESTLQELRFEKMKNIEQSSNWQNLLQFLIDVERNLNHPSGGH